MICGNTCKRKVTKDISEFKIIQADKDILKYLSEDIDYQRLSPIIYEKGTLGEFTEHRVALCNSCFDNLTKKANDKEYSQESIDGKNHIRIY